MWYWVEKKNIKKNMATTFSLVIGFKASSPAAHRTVSKKLDTFNTPTSYDHCCLYFIVSFWAAPLTCLSVSFACVPKPYVVCSLQISIYIYIIYIPKSNTFLVPIIQSCSCKSSCQTCHVFLFYLTWQNIIMQLIHLTFRSKHTKAKNKQKQKTCSNMLQQQQNKCNQTYTCMVQQTS